MSDGQSINIWDQSDSDSDSDIEVDWQEIIDKGQLDNDEQTGTMSMWLAIQKNHQKVLSKRWLIFSIAIQLTAIAGVFYVMLYLDLYRFVNGEGRLTPVLYYDKAEVAWWYFEFYDSHLESACINAGLESNGDTCRTLNESFIGNTVLDVSLVIATFFTVCSAVLVVCMFWKKYWRFTVSNEFVQYIIQNLCRIL